jgi:hypothetical protein
LRREFGKRVAGPVIVSLLVLTMIPPVFFNVEVVGSTSTNIVFSTNPYSIIYSPTNNSYQNKVSLINGSAQDSSSATGLKSVDLQIERKSDNYTWNGTTWNTVNNWLEASGTSQWSYYSSGIKWDSGVNYKIRSRATDNSNNVEVPSYGNLFLFDCEEPNSTITNPKSGSTNILPSTNITGTAKDNGGSGIDHVEINIWKSSGDWPPGYYWTGSEWSMTFEVTWLMVQGRTNWFYNGPKFSDQETYSIDSRAIDKAGNIQERITWVTIIYDTKNPQIIIDKSWHPDLWFKNLTDIEGEAYDTGSGIKEFEVNLTIGNNQWELETNVKWRVDYYDWNCDLSTVRWPDKIVTKAYVNITTTDYAGNTAKLNDYFLFDSKPPTSKITYPANNSTFRNLSAIKGTADDDGLPAYELWVYLYHVESNRFWYPIEKKWLPGNIGFYPFYMMVKNWTFNTSAIPMDNGTYYFYTKAYDCVFNVDSKNGGYRYDPNEESTIQQIKFTIDKKPPKISFRLNNGSMFINSTRLNFNISTESQSFNIEDVSFSMDNISWSPWYEFSPFMELELPPGDGEHAIYIRVRDDLWIFGYANVSFVMDTTAPDALSISINNNESMTNSTLVKMTLHASDLTSGIDSMSFSNDGVIWSDWEHFDNLISYSLPDGDGEKTVYFRTKDRAGNIADPIIGSIILNTTLDEPKEVSEEGTEDAITNDSEDAEVTDGSFNEEDKAEIEVTTLRAFIQELLEYFEFEVTIIDEKSEVFEEVEPDIENSDELIIVDKKTNENENRKTNIAIYLSVIVIGIVATLLTLFLRKRLIRHD